MWSDAAAAYPSHVKKVSRRISLEQNRLMMLDEFETTGMAWHEIRFLTHGSFLSRYSLESGELLRIARKWYCLLKIYQHDSWLKNAYECRIIK